MLSDELLQDLSLLYSISGRSLVRGVNVSCGSEAALKDLDSILCWGWD